MKKKISRKPVNKKLTWRKAWWFIWEDDSWASWFVNVVLAFIIIKFLVYPGLGLAMGTTHPIVAVVSSSMEHDGSFNNWWDSDAMCRGGKACTQKDYYNELNISKSEFESYKFKNGFNKGDIMILVGTDPEKIKRGDVIVYMANYPDPIIHRVIVSKDMGTNYAFATKGDHNVASFYFESYIPDDHYIGRAVVRIPLLGYIKLAFVSVLNLFK